MYNLVGEFLRIGQVRIDKATNGRAPIREVGALCGDAFALQQLNFVNIDKDKINIIDYYLYALL